MDDDFSQTAAGSLMQQSKGVNIQAVHSAGLTRVVHAPQSPQHTNPRLFTGGDDYLVRILPAQIDSSFEPLVIDDATKSITWIDADQDYLVTASEDGCVRIYQHSVAQSSNQDFSSAAPTDLVCILARCPLAARCATIEKHVPSGKTPRVAICSDDLVVKIVYVEDPKRVQLITGHQRGLRSASWSPSESILASCSTDGTVMLWDLSKTEPQQIKSFHGLIPTTSSESELTVEAAWHPSGTSFILPGKTHELIVVSFDVDRKEWKRSGSLVAPDDSAIPTASGDISYLSFSPNGRYLAAATTSGHITIWEWSSRRPLRFKSSEALVTSISWHPSLDALAWTDNAGQLHRWTGVVGTALPSPAEHVDFGNTKSVRQQRQREEIDDLFDGTGADDELDGHDTDEDEQREASGKSVAFRPSGRHDDARRYAGDMGKKQAPFQPTSTPMRNSRRFLAFNTIGSLIAIDQNTHQSISFESHDAGARRKWRFIDNYGYNIASIGPSGALLACPPQERSDVLDELQDDQAQTSSPSTVYYKPFETPGAWELPGSEWYVHLPRGERAVSLAMGGRRSRENGAVDSCTAVVATSEGYLRFFSGSGLQRYIWAFGNQVVTMCGGDRHLFVVHRNGSAVDSENMRFTLIDLISYSIKQEGFLPLTHDVTLVWVGFHEMDVPAIFDSRGVLMILDRALLSHGQARWTPILDTNTLTSKDGGEGMSSIKYWPIGFDGDNLLALMLKGQAFPDASSSNRPLIQELQLSLPVLEGPSSTLEEQVIRQTLFATLSKAFQASLQGDEAQDEYYAEILDKPYAKAPTLEHEADKAVLQIIQQACKNDKHQQVLDASRELHSGRTLDAAMQIGAFFHLSSLVDRMSALKEHVASRRDRDENLLTAGPVIIHAPAPSSSRILAASSPAPVGHEVKAAKQALSTDFTTKKPRSYGAGRTSELAKIAHSPNSSWSRSQVEGPTLSDSRQSVSEDEEYGGDGHPSISKRRSNDTDVELSNDEQRSMKRVRGGAPVEPSSPFTNKTGSSSFTAPTMSASGKNPFARTAAMTRDRSMHKSNSFFDRVDVAAPPATVVSRPKAKQATLFDISARHPSGSRSTSMSAATPAFADESQASHEESLRLTLSAAEAQDEDSAQLEETQYTDEYETQDLHEQASMHEGEQHSTRSVSIPVA